MPDAINKKTSSLSGKGQSRKRAGREPLSVVVYKSEANGSLDAASLQQLIRQAKRNNERRNITGMLLYDGAHFLQWLEGPSPSVKQTMKAIAADRRHSAIDIFIDRASGNRSFSDWAAALVTPQNAAKPVEPGIVSFSPTDLSDPLEGEDEAKKFISIFAEHVRANQEAYLTDHIRKPAHEDDGQFRKLLAERLPERLGKDLLNSFPPTNKARDDLQARALAQLLLSEQLNTAQRLIERVLDERNQSLAQTTSLLEATAANIGDMWYADDCEEVEATLAISNLVVILRRIDPDFRAVVAQNSPSVLVTPQPGTGNLLASVLDSEVLWRAGWKPERDFPKSDDELEALLAANWYDALDLSLSDRYSQFEMLPRMKETIRRARAASKNPLIAVITSGRAFHDEPASAGNVDADASLSSASEAAETITRAVNQKKNRTKADD